MTAITCIIPATNRPSTLPRVLESIAAAAAGPEQLIVVEDPSLTHPALARNAGARDARGDVLVFVDADVTVHADVFARFRAAFETDQELMAIFGAYDDTPDAPGIVSSFRNLLHHYVHHQNAGRASTFWTGLGAVRRHAFEAHGGFARHQTEDIEFGMRLSAAGGKVMLDPTIQGKHLKEWSLYSMLYTDLVVRGIPWVGLLIARHNTASTSTLNLSWRHRWSTIASLVTVAAACLAYWWIALGALAGLIALNLDFYRFLARRQGLLRAACGVGLHMLHHLVSIAAVPLGILSHLLRRPPSPSAGALA